MHTEPLKPGEFYSIIRRKGSDRADIIFAPGFETLYTPDGATEYDYENMFVLPNVTIYPGTEESIRRHYYVWLAHAEAFQRNSDAIHDAIQKAIDDASFFDFPID